MLQHILIVVLLLAGICYGIAILYNTYHSRDLLRSEPGSFLFIAVIEFLIYLCGSLGISGYLLNTLLLKHGRYTDDKHIPGTLVAGGLTPGAVIAAFLLRANASVDTATLLVCGFCAMAGGTVGAKLVGQFDSKLIKRIMQVALIASFVILIVKIAVTAGAAGTATSLTPLQLCIAAAVCFLSGVTNMFGIPMKPTWTALFLILGMSPLITLTLVLVLASLSPLIGGHTVIRNKLYHHKTVFCATTFGTAGAILGTLLAITVSAATLNTILIVVMLIAIITMFRS